MYPKTITLLIFCFCVLGNFFAQGSLPRFPIRQGEQELRRIEATFDIINTTSEDIIFERSREELLKVARVRFRRDIDINNIEIREVSFTVPNPPRQRNRLMTVNAIGIAVKTPRSIQQIVQCAMNDLLLDSKIPPGSTIGIYYVERESNIDRLNFIVSEIDRALSNRGYIVARRDDIMDRLLLEQATQRVEGLFDLNTAVGMGEFAGASVVIDGRIEDNGKFGVLRLRATCVERNIGLGSGASDLDYGTEKVIPHSPSSNAVEFIHPFNGFAVSLGFVYSSPMGDDINLLKNNNIDIKAGNGFFVEFTYTFFQKSALQFEPGIRAITRNLMINDTNQNTFDIEGLLRLRLNPRFLKFDADETFAISPMLGVGTSLINYTAFAGIDLVYKKTFVIGLEYNFSHHFYDYITVQFYDQNLDFYRNRKIEFYRSSLMVSIGYLF